MLLWCLSHFIYNILFTAAYRKRSQVHSNTYFTDEETKNIENLSDLSKVIKIIKPRLNVGSLLLKYIL